MSVTIHQGSPQFPAVSGGIPPSSHETTDAAVQTLQEHKDAWVALPNRERIAILDRLINDFAAVAPRWAAASLQAKGVTCHYLGQSQLRKDPTYDQ
jgi:acyl-CoA reductase-like NAD-dependent aldehyde dehydrogenase